MNFDNEIVAITHCFTQDNIHFQKVIGVFDNEKSLLEALEDILEFFKNDNIEIKKKSIDNNGHFYVEYDDDAHNYFYTGTFEINRLKL